MQGICVYQTQLLLLLSLIILLLFFLFLSHLCFLIGDTSAPVVTACPEDITTFVSFQTPGTTVTWTEPTVFDNSGAFDTTQTRTSGAFFAVGDSQVAYTFADAAGNQATCTFLVRVIQQGND